MDDFAAKLLGTAIERYPSLERVTTGAVFVKREQQPLMTLMNTDLDEGWDIVFRIKDYQCKSVPSVVE